MKSVGVREFRDHATAYLSGGEPLAVRKHGRVIGFYIPVERDQEEINRALNELGGLVQEIVRDNGMSEEEFAQLLDLRRPLPE
jgi:hypothetical protein